MASGRRGPRPGTVNNPQGKNQWTSGMSVAKSPVSVSSGVSGITAPKPKLKRDYKRSMTEGAASLRNRVAGAKVKVQSGTYAAGSGDKSKKTLAHRVTRARIKARGATRVFRDKESKLNVGVAKVRSRVAEMKAKRQSGSYAKGSGDKTKSGLGYKITRARIKNRNKTRGMRTAAATVQNKVKSGVASTRSRVADIRAKSRANRFAKGSGSEPKVTLRKKLANRLGSFRRDQV